MNTIIVAIVAIAIAIFVWWKWFKRFGPSYVIRPLYRFDSYYDSDPSRILLAQYQPKVKSLDRNEKDFYLDALRAGYSPAPADVMQSISFRHNLPACVELQSRIAKDKVCLIRTGPERSNPELTEHSGNMLFDRVSYVVLVPTDELRTKPSVVGECRRHIPTRRSPLIPTRR